MDNKLFVECFSKITDPRVDRTKKHLLIDIIALSICAVIAGAQGWEEMEEFGHLNKEWLANFLTLPNGIPSHDTISRLFAVLKPELIQECSLEWLNKIKDLIPETIIPIDGKTLKRSGCKKTSRKALHAINAWSSANSISLGQLKVNGKSNEITAVPKILDQLFIKDATITLDAMGCQEETVAKICDAGADYVIALKGNQGDLHETVKDPFAMVWDKIRLQLELCPERTAKSLLEELINENPKQFNINLLRTLQRRVAVWRIQQTKISQARISQENASEDKTSKQYVRATS